jgi:hypothetical protein
MMLGGVGFQAGLDETRREQSPGGDAPQAAGIVEQLRGLKALLDEGVLTPEEFQAAKRKVLDR